jgi:hypothetical protein
MMAPRCEPCTASAAASRERRHAAVSSQPITSRVRTEPGDARVPTASLRRPRHHPIAAGPLMGGGGCGGLPPLTTSEPGSAEGGALCRGWRGSAPPARLASSAGFAARLIDTP